MPVHKRAIYKQNVHTRQIADVILAHRLNKLPTSVSSRIRQHFSAQVRAEIVHSCFDVPLHDLCFNLEHHFGEKSRHMRVEESSLFCTRLRRIGAV